MWNPTNQIHARLYYTAQVLGKVEEMHTAIFREIHVNRNMLTTEEDIQKLFAQFGVGQEDFRKTFRSFAVEALLNRAKELTEDYEVRSVPILIVNGKYNTDAPGIKSYDNMLQVVNELIERERRL
jgi:thiol:disulfide interchange protein DsbA